MDLNIKKHESFITTGAVETETYLKPNHRPQYLAFQSQHSLACKLALFRCETTRHLINCSTEAAYRKIVLRLRNDLKARVYPMSLLPDAPYDEPARQKHIDELFRRSREPKAKNGSMDTDRLVFKVEHSQQLRLVNIRKEFKELVRCLRMHVGSGLLRETRLIIAHPVSTPSRRALWNQFSSSAQRHAHEKATARQG